MCAGKAKEYVSIMVASRSIAIRYYVKMDREEPFPVWFTSNYNIKINGYKFKMAQKLLDSLALIPKYNCFITSDGAITC
jgi:hypothetical protein